MVCAAALAAFLGVLALAARPAAAQESAQPLRFTLKTIENEAGVRVILEFNVQGSSSWQLCYLVRHGSQIWAFNFGALKEDFYQLQPIFEQSLQTLRFLP